MGRAQTHDDAGRVAGGEPRDRALIPSSALIDNDWVFYAQQTIEDHSDLYRYYLHTNTIPVAVDGGSYGAQTISPLAISASDEAYLVATLQRLDRLIDLDFERTDNASAAGMRYFHDSVFEITGNPLGITIATGGPAERWFEVLLDGSRLTDQAYRRYAAIHEFGHTLGLEHPFESGDGDSHGGTNPWTSSVYPEDTVMAYRNPRSGPWPQWYSASDIRALVEIWGLEDDQRGSYQLERASSGQVLLVGDPTTASQAITSGSWQLVDFQPCQLVQYGSEADDILIGVAPFAGGWMDEWFAGGGGADLIAGGGGRDQLLGGDGDDTLRGGHGQDALEGGNGNDQLYGGGGRNTLMPGPGADRLFVLSDQVSHGEAAGRAHGGNLADVVVGLESDDRITILGCRSDELQCIALEDGLGVMAQGVLEAIVVDSNLSLSQLAGLVSGDPTRWF